VEFNAVVGEVDPIGNWYAMRETDKLPALIFGTSSDRIGTPKGKQAYYITVAKQPGNLPVAPYFSINYSQTDYAFNVPFGATVQIDNHWSIMGMYDGHASHTLVTWSGKRESIQLIWAWNRRIGASFGYRW
jgi:hypothetical protein